MNDAAVRSLATALSRFADLLTQGMKARLDAIEKRLENLEKGPPPRP